MAPGAQYFGGQIFYTTGGIAPPVGAPQGRGALYRVGKDGTPVSVATGFFRPTGIAFVGQEIAERMGKSIHAVKFLLHRIYQITGIPSRAALVAALRAGPTLEPLGHPACPTLREVAAGHFVGSMPSRPRLAHAARRCLSFE